MIPVSQSFLDEVQDLVTHSHWWFIAITDSGASPVSYMITESILGSLNGIDWTLEKDWSMFLAGDVSFTVHDKDGYLRNYFNTKTAPFKIKIYAQYPDSQCLCFHGYIKLEGMEITDDDVTLYAVSTFGNLENYTYDQETANLYGLKTLREVLTNGDFTDAGLNNFDLKLSSLISYPITNLACMFETVPSNNRETTPIDCIKYYEDTEKYHIMMFRVSPTSGTNIEVYKAYLYKDDYSKIVEQENTLLTIPIGERIYKLKALYAPTSAVRFVLLVGTSSTNYGFKKIVAIKDTLNDYRIRNFYNASIADYWGIINSAAIDESSDYLCFAANLNPNNRTYPYYAVIIWLPNLWATGNIAGDSIASGGNYIVYSADLTKNPVTNDYYFVTCEEGAGYASTFSLFTFVQFGAISHVERETPDNTVFTVAGSGKYFFFNHTLKYYDAENHYQVEGYVPNYYRMVTSQIKDSTKYVFHFDYVPTTTNYIHKHYSDESGELQSQQYTYEIFSGQQLNEYKLLYSSTARLLNLGYPNDEFVIPAGDKFTVVSGKLPLLIDMGTVQNPILDGLSYKEAIRQLVGCYLLTAHVRPDIDMNDTLIVQPRSSVSPPYVIPQENIIMDSINIAEKFPIYNITVNSQDSTGSYPSPIISGVETLEFNYNTLPVPPATGNFPYLRIIAYNLYLYFLNWCRYRIKLQTDSLFYLEPTDWVQVRDTLNNKTYRGVLVKNSIGEDGICDMEILGKEI